jgi:hypothetical protein
MGHVSSRWWGAEEEVGGSLGDFGAAAGEDVAVDVEGDAGVGVAQALGHVGDRDASGEEHRGVGVAQVVVMPRSA